MLLLPPTLRSEPKQIGWRSAQPVPMLRPCIRLNAVAPRWQLGRTREKQHPRKAIVRNISALSNPRIFYGWFVFYGGFVVTAAFAITFVGFGSAYAFSAFVASLQQDFGASRGSVSLVFSLAGFLGLGIVTGPLADRWGSRRLAIIGMLLTGIGLALASTARSLTEVYLA